MAEENTTINENLQQRFVKLQSACQTLKDSIKTIYDNALSNEDLNRLASGTDEIEKMIATSPAVLISTSINDAKGNLDIYNLFEYYKFDSDIFDKQRLFLAPELLEGELKDIIFSHKELIVSERVKDNELLVDVGKVWLDALLSDILYKKFPFTTTSAILQIKNEISDDSNLSVLISHIAIFEKFEKEVLNDPQNNHLDETAQARIKCDCFKSYVGALIVDNNNITSNDLTVWLRALFEPLIHKLEYNNLNGLYAGNPKEQLIHFMENNKFGLELRFDTDVKTSESVVCNIYLGNKIIAMGDGSDDETAKQNAAASILADDTIVSKYSNYAFTSDETSNYVSDRLEDVAKTNKETEIELEQKSGTLPDDDSTTQSTVNTEPKKESKGTVQRTTEEMRELPLNTTSRKTDKATLYREIGMYNCYPQYITIQLGLNDFYSSCHILNKQNSFLGEGRGSNKKTAEQIAATSVLESKSYKAFFNSERGDMDGTKSEAYDNIHLLTDDEDDDHTKQDKNNPNSIENSQLFKPSYYLDLELHTTCDKMAMTELYAELGKYGFQPEYQTQAIEINDFYSFCLVKNTSVILGEGRGTSKKISQQIAATCALDGEALKDFVTE